MKKGTDFMKVDMDSVAGGTQKKKKISSGKPMKARVISARQSPKTKVIDLGLMKNHKSKGKGKV